jgi:hypothetical protein
MQISVSFEIRRMMREEPDVLEEEFSPALASFFTVLAGLFAISFGLYLYFIF